MSAPVTFKTGAHAAQIVCASLPNAYSKKRLAQRAPVSPRQWRDTGALSLFSSTAFEPQPRTPQRSI
jgi:hypothetical protein